MTSSTRFTSATIVLKSDNGVSPRILELRKKYIIVNILIMPCRELHK